MNQFARRSRVHGVALVAAAAMLIACTDGSGEATTTDATVVPETTTHPALSSTTPSTTQRPTTTTTTTSAAMVTGPLQLRKLNPFAAYSWVPPLADDSVYAGPPTPKSLNEVLLVDFQQSVNDDAELTEMLEAQGFAIRPAGYGPYFHNVYKAAAYWYQPLFVTTDAVYHSWHLAFDKVLRDIEQQHPPADPRTVRRHSSCQQHVCSNSNLPARRSRLDAERATAYYEAAAELLGLDLGMTSDRVSRGSRLGTQGRRRRPDHRSLASPNAVPRHEVRWLRRLQPVPDRAGTTPAPPT